MKEVEIPAINQNVFETMIFTPRGDHQPPNRQRASHREFANHALVGNPRGVAVEHSVDNQQSSQQPWNGHEAVVNAFERLDFGVAQRAPLDPDRQRQCREKECPNKNQDPVDFHGRVLNARGDERQSSEYKNGRPIEQPLAQKQFCENDARTFFLARRQFLLPNR